VALFLALIETSVLFTAVSGAVLLWARPILVDWIDVMSVLGQGVAVSLCCVVSFYYNDLYDLHIVRSFGGFTARLLQSFGVAFILLAFFYALFPGARITEGVFVSSLFTVLGFLLPLRAISYVVMRSRPFVERVLILGTGALSTKLVAEIEARPESRYAVAGIVGEGATGRAAPESGPPLLGPMTSLQKIVEEERVDRVIVAMAERRGRLPMDQLLAIRVQSGVMVEDGAEAYEHLTEKLAVDTLTPSALIFSKDFRKSPLDLAVSRTISLVTSVIGLIALAPLLGLIALAITLDSPGPVFFVQARAGRHGRDFRLIKFRTMRPASRETSEWAGDNDDRVTRIGKWLRKFRLDELPQFLNILRGDMNLVGPRPHPVSNYQLFIENIPYYALRSGVRPGVTGWAQVRYGYANNLEEETEKMRYDLYYIKHLSLWFDLRILLDTVKIILFGRGSTAPDAYRADVPVDAARDALSRETNGASHERRVSGGSPSQSIGGLEPEANGVPSPTRDQSHSLPAATYGTIGAVRAPRPQLGGAGGTDLRAVSRHGTDGQARNANERQAGRAASRGAMASLLTFDVEEWFQVENLRAVFPRANWESVPRRVVRATQVILDLLAERQLRATFFILGWVTEREPALVSEIAKRGHEIAAHGYGHVLPMQLTSMEFRNDVLRARKILEDLTGKPVVGYRAPSFNLNHEHLAILAECGYRYDSSVHPFTLHDRYARLDDLGKPLRPGVYRTNGGITELALPVERFGWLQLPISGGGYFRLYPGALFRRLVGRAIVRDGHHIMYLHSWEFDPEMPRVKVRGGARFRHYNNLARTLPRMRKLVGMLKAMGASFLTVNEFLDGLDPGPRGESMSSLPGARDPQTSAAGT
jgi:exopolysaccharide biosynthesis polyprenyl glycosylphosphotransferase/polysaccharide deacetylase family protein (PEP-CTERM system associated)